MLTGKSGTLTGTAGTFRLAPAEKGRFRTESGNMEEHMSLTQEEYARAFGVEDDMPAADADTDGSACRAACGSICGIGRNTGFADRRA